MRKRSLRIDRLVAGLTLTDAQQKEVDALKAAAAADAVPGGKRGRYLSTILQKFDEQTLDANSVDVASHHETKIERMKKRAARVAALSEVLDETQRKTVASRIRERANRISSR